MRLSTFTVRRFLQEMIIPKASLLLVIGVVFSCIDTVAAQESTINTDSPCKTSLDSAVYYFGKDLDRAQQWTEVALACGQNNNSPQAQGIALRYQAGRFIQLGQIDSALTRLHRALSLFNEANDDYNTLKVYLNIALCHHSLDERDKVFEWLNSALSFAKKTGNKEGVAETSQKLAVIYMLEDLPDKALQHLKVAQDLFSEIGDQPLLKGATFGTLSETYAAQNDFASAIEYRLKQLEQYKKGGREDAIFYSEAHLAYLYSQIDDDKALTLLQGLEQSPVLGRNPNETATYYDAYSIYVYRKGNYDKALELALAGYKVANEASLLFLKGQIAFRIGTILTAKNELSQALPYIEEAKVIFQQNRNLSLQAEIEELLAENQRMQGNYEVALGHAQTYALFKDSLYKKDLLEVTKEAQVRYETAEKEQEITLLEKDNTVQRLEVEKNRRVALLLGILAIVLISSGLFGFKLARQRKQLNEKLSAKNTALRSMFESKNKLLRVLSHDIRTPLSYIKAALQMLALKDGLDQKQITEIQARAIDTATFMESVTSKVLLSMSQEDEALEIRKEVLSLKEAAHSWLDQMQTLAQQKGVQLILDVQAKEISTDPVLLQQIFNNLVSNAIKVSPEKATVQIQFNQNQSKALQLEVIDEGAGYQPTSQPQNDSHGFGLQLTEYYVNLLNGSLNWRLNNDAGTTFQVVIPV